MPLTAPDVEGGRAYCDLAAQMAARNVRGSAVEEGRRWFDERTAIRFRVAPGAQITCVVHSQV